MVTRRPYLTHQTRVELRRRREARVLWFDRAAFVAAHLIPAALLVWVVGKLFL